MDEFKQAFLLIWTKWWLSIVGVAVGIIGKFGYDMVSGKKFSRAAFWGSLLVCIFVGYITAVGCKYKGWIEASSILVPVATALSQTVMQGIMQNKDKILRKIFGNTFTKDDEKA